MYSLTGLKLSSMLIVGLQIYILLKHPRYTSNIRLEINTVLPLKLGAKIVALVGNLGTCSPYLDCLHAYYICFIGVMIGALLSVILSLHYIYIIHFLVFELYKMGAYCCTEEDIEYETINGENINETNSEKSISSLHVNNDIELLAISGVVLP